MNDNPAHAASVHQSGIEVFSGRALTWMRYLGIVLCGSLFVAICAHVTLPLAFTPVPLTLQDFAVMALGLLLTPRLAVATMLAYLAEGAAGLPVFAPGTIELTGLAHLLGPTGGYLMAYPTVALVTAKVWRSGAANCAGAVISAAAGNLILLAIGGAWLGMTTHSSMDTVVNLAVMPFLPGDALKVCLAAAVGFEWSRMRPAPRKPLRLI